MATPPSPQLSFSCAFPNCSIKNVCNSLGVNPKNGSLKYIFGTKKRGGMGSGRGKVGAGAGVGVENCVSYLNFVRERKSAEVFRRQVKQVRLLR